MSSAKIAISIDYNLLKKLDYLVDAKLFKNRSQAFQKSIQKTIERVEHQRLAKECAKLNIKLEQQMADDGLIEDCKQWPEY